MKIKLSQLSPYISGLLITVLYVCLNVSARVDSLIIVCIIAPLMLFGLTFLLWNQHVAVVVAEVAVGTSLVLLLVGPIALRMAFGPLRFSPGVYKLPDPSIIEILDKQRPTYAKSVGVVDDTTTYFYDKVNPFDIGEILSYPPKTVWASCQVEGRAHDFCEDKWLTTKELQERQTSNDASNRVQDNPGVLAKLKQLANSPATLCSVQLPLFTPVDKNDESQGRNATGERAYLCVNKQLQMIEFVYWDD